ncbi:MAG TPA: universal stress protein [Fermentimonas sp.]|nr:universal stress protein [Fermentimonas sp.]
MQRVNKDDQLNNDKLVTVAIHTYEKAQILKSILESEGIPSVIHGVNLIEPTIPGSVRVRIRESDLQSALRVIEQVDFTSKLTNDEDQDDKGKELSNEILIPVDFSDYTILTCEFGFKLAHDLNCSVKLMHAFFTPFYPAAIPFSDAFTIPISDKDIYQDIRKKTEKDMNELIKKIDAQIANNTFPNVNYTHTLIEGLPEEEIITYSKKMKPIAIVMGTRGKNAKDLDLIGSVTAEVMDGCKTPIFAVPEDAKVRNLSEIKRIVFLTNFQEREFKAFDIMMKFLKPYPVKLFLAHIAKKDDVWNEIKLSGLQKYLTESNPRLQTEYKLIDQSESLEVSLEKFVDENNIDMISLSSSRRNLFARMFNPGIARRMLFHSDTPILVIKGF